MHNKLNEKIWGRIKNSVTASNASLALAILIGWWPVVIIATAWVYISTIKYKFSNYKNTFLIFLATNFYFMLIPTWWFSRIEPAGWLKTIGPFPPSFWLVTVLILICLFSSIIFSSVICLIIYLLKITKYQIPRFLIPLVFAASMLWIEIFRAYVFSLLTHAKTLPIEPFWNIYSVGSAVTGFWPIKIWYSLVGMWGVSFILYLLVAVIISTRTKKNRLYILTGLAFVFISPIIISSFRIKQNNEEIKVYAVSISHENQLEDEFIKSINTDDISLVVLPEYSNISTSPTQLPSQNLRDKFVPILKTKPNLQITNTEAVRLNDIVYVQSYVINSNNSKTNQKIKRFLVPGGEYIIRWVHWIFAKLDPIAEIQFEHNRGRKVVDQKEVNFEYSKNSEILPQIIAIACSTILTPYEVNNGVKKGGQIVSVNVSYEQFQKTSNYSNIVARFSRVIALSVKKPVIVGALKGPAIITNTDGSQNIKTESIIQKVEINKELSFYSRYGDKYIITAISFFSLLMLVIVSKYSLKQRR